MESYIRFDWAMKRLLRNKANYAVLEGLLTTLLEEKVTIQKLLESESNQEGEFDKYNRGYAGGKLEGRTGAHRDSEQ